MKHWTGARTWDEGVKKMAMEPTSDPVLAEQERKTDEIVREFHRRMFLDFITRKSSIQEAFERRRNRR